MVGKPPVELLSSRTIECPGCGEECSVGEWFFESSSGESMMLVVARCGRCGSRSVLTPPMGEPGPQRLEVVVDDPSKLNMIVYRSPAGSLRIPELGVEVSPGVYSRDHITTVEGVLRDIAGVLSLFESPKALEVRARLESMMKGGERFTLVLTYQHPTIYLLDQRL
ncbi:MAG TPA: hypothetical protein EYP11_06070 [Aquificaceae bacterium]|nr:hypothetical protein [Aquificaceae bacterium]